MSIMEINGNNRNGGRMTDGRINEKSSVQGTFIDIEEFLKNPDIYFDRVDAGERIYLRWNNKLYAIVPVDVD